jgi:hypothetical protein
MVGASSTGGSVTQTCIVRPSQRTRFLEARGWTSTVRIMLPRVHCVPVKIESPQFTLADLETFLGETLDYERLRLADRLEADSARLAAVVSTTRVSGESAGAGWSGREIVAHIVALSKFYGVLTYKVGKGAVKDVDLLSNLQARDLAGEQLTALPTEQLVKMALREHRHTAEYLRSADREQMTRRAAVVEGRTMSALELCQLGLCAHLELHLDQLEAVLRSS